LRVRFTSISSEGLPTNTLFISFFMFKRVAPQGPLNHANTCLLRLVRCFSYETSLRRSTTIDPPFQFYCHLPPMCLSWIPGHSPSFRSPNRTYIAKPSAMLSFPSPFTSLFLFPPPNELVSARIDSRWIHSPPSD